MRITWYNNPITWLVGLAMTAVVALLIINLVFRQDVPSSMPEHVFVQPAVQPSSAEVLLLDSVTLRASASYQANDAQRWVHGQMYRDAWHAPVRVPVWNLATVVPGGLTPTDKGGGFQTLSLDLVDTAGMVYTLRSVNKNPEKLIPPWAAAVGMDNVVVDGISAGHPYGSLPAAALAEAVGLLHMHPRLGYVPAQRGLGKFDEQFGDHLFWLEYEPEDSVGAWTQLAGRANWHDSEDVFEEWQADSTSVKPDLDWLVRARMLDNWMGDWDRHAGQWGWAEYQGDDGKRHFMPVPNDRDNVFYGIGGLIPGVISTFERRLQAFGPDIDDLDGLTLNSADFDGAFLYDVPESVYVEQSQSLQRLLTDEVIDAAVHSWPDSVYAKDGARIAGYLKARRKYLVDYAPAYREVIRARGRVTKLEED